MQHGDRLIGAAELSEVGYLCQVDRHQLLTLETQVTTGQVVGDGDGACRDREGHQAPGGRANLLWGGRAVGDGEVNLPGQEGADARPRTHHLQLGKDARFNRELVEPKQEGLGGKGAGGSAQRGGRRGIPGATRATCQQGSERQSSAGTGHHRLRSSATSMVAVMSIRPLAIGLA